MFINDLYKLAKPCKFETLRDELKRDIIVTNVQSTKLSENLQLHLELTLQKAIENDR